MKPQGILVFALLLGNGTAAAQTGSGAPFIAVHGEARREVVPDLFPLEVILSETSTDTAGTQARIEGLAEKVLAIADSLKVDDADLTVANLSISPEYDYDDDTNKQVFLGNKYERDIDVRFHSLDRLREFVSSLPADKALRVGTKNFETTHAAEVKRSLLQDAIADAQATATALATGVGRRLGPVNTISNQALNVRYSEGGGTSLAAVSVSGTKLLEAPGVVALREGSITLDQDVYIIYALE